MQNSNHFKKILAFCLSAALMLSCASGLRLDVKAAEAETTAAVQQNIPADMCLLPVNHATTNLTYLLVENASVIGGGDRSMKVQTGDTAGAIGFHLPVASKLNPGLFTGWFHFGDLAPAAKMSVNYADGRMSNAVAITFEAKSNGWYFGTVNCAVFDSNPVVGFNIVDLPKNAVIVMDQFHCATTALEGLNVSYPYNSEVFAQEDTPINRFQELTFDSAKNEVEIAQMIFTPNFDVTSYDFKMDNLYNANGNILPASYFEVFAAHYVKVTNSLNGGREAYDKNTGKTYWNAEAYGVPGKNGTFPDALVPIDFKIAAGENTVESGKQQAIWVNVNLPKDIAPGKYTGHAVLTVNNEPVLIPVSVNVRDVAISDEVHVKGCNLMWWDALGIALNGENDLTISQINSYYDYMISKRQMMYDHSYTRFDSWYVDYIATTLAPNPKVSSYGLENYTADGGLDVAHAKSMLTRMINKQIELLESGSSVDMFKKAFFYYGNFCDEPRNEERYALCNQASKDLDTIKTELAPLLADYPEIQKSFLNLRHLVTGPNPLDETFSYIAWQDYGDVPLEGDDHVYCPQFQWYHTEEQRALYENEPEIWWYGCTHPVQPYPTTQTNSPLIATRVLGMMMYDYNISGELRWNVNNWYNYSEAKMKDIWNEHADACPGESMLIYPGTRYGSEKPIATIRLETSREGYEDYEYFWLYEQMVGEDADISAFTANMYDGVIPNTDPSYHYQNRQAILQEIEKLSIAQNGATVKASEIQLPDMTTPEIPEDFLSNASCSAAELQTEITNLSQSAWMLTPGSGMSYPKFTLDSTYDISNHLLALDVMYTGATALRLNLQNVNESVYSGTACGYFPANTWGTLIFDLSASGVDVMSTLTLALEVVESSAATLYIDNVQLLNKAFDIIPESDLLTENEETDLINLPHNAGTFDGTTVFNQDSVHSLYADCSSKSVNVTFDLTGATDLSDCEISAWFYFSGNAPTATNARLQIANEEGANSGYLIVSFDTQNPVNGWYKGSVETASIDSSKLKALQSATKLLIQLRSGNGPAYIDNLQIQNNELALTAADPALDVIQTERTNGSRYAWKMDAGSGWRYPTFHLDEKQDITQCALVMDLYPTGSASFRINLSKINGDWGVGSGSASYLTPNQWSTVTFNLPDFNDLYDVMESFTLGYAFEGEVTGNKALYVDNVRLIPTEGVKQDWININKDIGDYYCNTEATYTTEKVYASNSVHSLKVVPQIAGAEAKFTLNTSVLDPGPNMTSGFLGAWFYFENCQDPSVYVTFTARNWKGSVAKHMNLTPRGDGWYYGLLDTSKIVFTEGADMSEVIRICFHTPADTTFYVDGITYPAQIPEEDILSNATCPDGEIQIQETNNSYTAWKLTPELGTTYWAYPTFTLDRSYNTEGCKLVMDVKAVNANSFRLHLASLGNYKPYTEGAKWYSVGQWQTVEFDISQYQSIEKIALGVELKHDTDAQYALYVDNVRIERIKKVDSVELTKLPETLTYYQNESDLDVTGGQLTISYQGGTSEIVDITADMVSGFDKAKLGTQTVTVTYQGYTFTYQVEVLQRNYISNWNLTLKDNIGVTFQMDTQQIMERDEKAQVTVTVDGASYTYAVADLAENELQVAVSAAQMTTPIVVNVLSESGDMLWSRSYTVRQYADAILSGNYTQEAKNLVKAMLAYGADCQIYFQYNDKILADDEIIMGEQSVPANNGTKIATEGTLEGIAFYGASLLARDKTAIRFYFTVDGDISQYTFTCNGNPLEPVKAGQYYCVTVGQMAPNALNDSFTVSVNDAIRVTYSPMVYIERMYYKSTSTQENKDFALSLYNYYLAAVAYVASL